VGALSESLGRGGYLADKGTVTALFVAYQLRRPLFLEGEAGVGKTELAKVFSQVTGARLIRLQCYEGIDARQALYDWDYARQMLYIRALESDSVRSTDAIKSVFGRDFLIRRPLLETLEAEEDVVLLIDEIDRADDEFEAFLLELLSDFQVSIPEIGTIRAKRRPMVILTSNRTREVHDALKRRCFYHWIEYPDHDREIAIIRARLPEVSERLAEQVCSAVAQMREMPLRKPPGIGESLDWVASLAVLGLEELDRDAVQISLGAVLKVREDQERAIAAFTSAH
jgi:MoxR-like ATPase